MHTVLRRTLKIVGWVFASAVIVIGAIVIHLVYIGDPGDAKSLAFNGFLLLPKQSSLSVLDYLTISGDRLFVTNESSGTVYKVAIGKSLLPQVSDVTVFNSDPAAHGVAVNPHKAEAYVTRSETNAVDVFDPDTMKALARIPVPDDADAIYFDTAHNLLYVANGDAHQGTLIDPDSRKVVAEVQVGGKPEFVAYDSQTQLLYQNLRDTNSVAAIDVTARKVVDHWVLSGCQEPAAMAIDETSRRLFLGCAANARLLVFNIDTHTVTASLEVGGGPDSIVYDAPLHRLYATGKSGVMTVMRQDGPDSYVTLDTIKLHYGAHTLAVDPATHRVYVGYAGLLVAPRLAVFMPR